MKWRQWFGRNVPRHAGAVCFEDDCDHEWGDWSMAYVGSHEVRFCARCGDMEQQWIEP